jgi:hypothetical protein
MKHRSRLSRNGDIIPYNVTYILVATLSCGDKPSPTYGTECISASLGESTECVPSSNIRTVTGSILGGVTILTKREGEFVSFLSHFQVNGRITHWQTASEVNAELPNSKLQWLQRRMHYLLQHYKTTFSHRLELCVSYNSHNKRLFP